MTARNRNIIVGLVVLAGLLALAWMILQFSGAPAASLFTKGTPFKVIVNRADGVADGSAVQYLGVPVGRVTAVHRLPDNQRVQIDAVLDEGEKLPKNILGIIRPQSALGTGAAVTLEVKAGEQPSNDLLKSGDQIDATNRNNGLIPPEFTDLARSVQEQKIIEHLDGTIQELHAQLRKAGELMEGFNKLVGDPKMKDDIAASIANFRKTTENVDKFTSRLDGLADQTDQTLKQTRTTLADATEKFDAMSRQLNERMTQVGDLLEKFNTITAKVEKGQGTLGMLVNDARLYESLLDTGKTLNLTVADLRRLVEQWEQEGFTLKLK